jgi:FkbM family methyltransferase
LSEILHQGDTFIDVGANLGYFTILGSRLVGQGGNVVSFEPMPINFEYCKKNIALNNLDNVTLYNNGLWDREEKKEIAIRTSSYAEAHFGSLDSHEMKATVECITLDKMNLDPEVIKMDIEGAEPMALKGMLKTLENSKPVLVMELNRHCLNTFYSLDTIDVWTPLYELGYEIRIFPPKPRKKSIVLRN